MTDWRMEQFDIVIVGAGHGGAQTAIALRQEGFAGTILLIGSEPELPYERPPLSKEYLLRERPFEQILIRPEPFWEKIAIKLRLGCRVTAVDAGNSQVTLDGGPIVGFSKLVWATGGVPRRLSCAGHDLEGVHTVRSRSDVDRMLSELEGVDHAVIVGGGYVGLEAAAGLSALGKRVTVIEAQDRVLSRVAGEPLSRFYETEHRARGVSIRLGAKVECLEGEGGWVRRVLLADGEVLACHMVIVGVGIQPEVGPLIAAGARGDDGVAVDAHCQTSLPNVYAVGDCALHRNVFADNRAIRLESVQNASDQATVVAKTLAGTVDEYRSVPWFWSNQYDLRLQTVGLSAGYDQCVVRGELEARTFSLVYLKNGRVIALDCINAPADYVQGRSLVINRVECTPAELSDRSVSLKELSSRFAGRSVASH